MQGLPRRYGDDPYHGLRLEIAREAAPQVRG